MGAGDLLGGMKSPGDLYAGILKSHSIASVLVKQFDLMKVYGVKKESQAEKTLGSSTVVRWILSRRLCRSTSPRRAPSSRTISPVPTWTRCAIRMGDWQLSQSSQRRLFFGQQLAKEKDDLEDAEVEIKRTEEQSGLIAPTGQTEAGDQDDCRHASGDRGREVQLAALRDSATEQNPELIRLRSEIADLQGQLSRLQSGSGDKSTATIPTSKVPEIQLEYVRKDREVKYHEALFEMLSRQFEAARLDEARDAPVLQVLDPATYPDTKSWPKRSYFMLGGLLVGFIGGCVWVLAREPLRALRASLASGEAA